ncbi:alpha-amylase family protein [Microlunatus speluncae]|uniref:alpha-amylase family protein n=1 Tax=Microlunatus speluncae TaxID=2594267 RepID=UPI00126663EA|nr:alpha-amylase family protein [Microlunatus speluncae]
MTADAGERARWWERPFEMFQTNLREIDAGLDVDAILDAIQRHGADTWLINTGGILANYPSELPFHTRNPFLRERSSGDLVGDAVRAAHDRGMRLMARMDFSKIALPIADEHPDWCFRSRDGNRQQIEGLASVCPSGDYYQHRTFDILDEILDRYPIDGFFFNWFGYSEVDYHGVRHGVCHCDACQVRFAEAADGLTLPAGPESPDFPRWRAFCRGVLDDLTGRIRDHLAARRPDAPLILGSRSDIVFHEANNKIGRELWPSATAEAVSAAKTVRPDKPVLVNSTVFVDMPYRMAAEDPHHVGQFFAQAIARGANPSTYIMGPVGVINYPGLEAAAELTRFHRDHRAVYDGLRPAATVALVRPDAMTQSGPARDEFLGWYAALQQGHVPFDVLPVERLAEAARLGALSRFRTLILPDLGPLPAEVITALDGIGDTTAFVITGSSALAGDQDQLSRSPGGRVTGRHLGFTETRSTYATDGDTLLPIYGDLFDLDLPAEAAVNWRVLPQASFAPPEKAYGHQVSELAAVAANAAGTAVRVAWTIGRTFREFGTGDLRRLMLELVRGLAGPQPVADSDLPEQVEVIIGTNGSRTVVHLINLSGARRQGFGAPLPISGARLRLPAGTSARSLVSDQDCKIRQDSDSILVELPSFELFEVIVI